MSETKPKVHFIAIGGSVMHNLALALHKKGYQVSGSDDEIFDPSRTRLKEAGLYPEKEGWYPEKITSDLSAVILGMHARKDNPELAKARELGVKIYSFPEYIYQQSRDKQRVVIAGSHGKTTITSMILHVLQHYNKKIDYLVGANLEGFDLTVRLSDDAPVIIIEGDEYLSSPVDTTPKFLHYHHHIGLISGIAWDHINVFPTFDDYVRQFEAFADSSGKGGTLIYNESDDLVTIICSKEREDVHQVPYQALPHKIENGKTYLKTEDGDMEVKVFGKHNMKNLAGAKAVCNRLGITDKMFFEAISSFKGASNRLEALIESDKTTIYRDFAHAPSKLKATVNAVKKQFPERELVGVLELHTFSSLNKGFLSQYKGTFDSADYPVVYFNPETVKHKKLEMISEEDIKDAFGNQDLQVITTTEEVQAKLKSIDWRGKNLLLMSSGNFGGMDVKEFSRQLIQK